MVCTFFGHRDCVELDKRRVYEAIEGAINEGAEVFLVGNQGRFDRVAYSCLKQLRKSYPQIRISVVLSRLPVMRDAVLDEEDTVFPEFVDNVPPQYAIDRRNRWMVDKADLVICYIQRPWGGAYKFADLAARQGKAVRNLGSVKLGKGV